MKKIKKGIPRRSRRKYSCEIMPFRKNCTRKEKKKMENSLGWEAKQVGNNQQVLLPTQIYLTKHLFT